MVGRTAWRGISREAATTLSELGELCRAEPELPEGERGWGGSWICVAKSEKSLRSPVAGRPLNFEEGALTASESGKGSQRHSVSAQ